jgi:hypothetical protein
MREPEALGKARLKRTLLQNSVPKQPDRMPFAP